MGLKLRTQIAGILFLLFTLTVLILGYFNISILYDSMRSQAEEQFGVVASNLVSWFEKTLPPEGYSEQYLKLRSAQRGDLAEYLRDIKSLRCFQVTDASGQVIYSYGRESFPVPLHAEALREISHTLRPMGRLWEYDNPGDRAGRPVGSRGFLITRYLSYEYYSPVLRDRQFVAAFHVSLAVEEMPRRMHVMFLGNLLLSMVFLTTAFVAISIWTAHAINRPIEFLLRAQERIGKGDFSAHVHLDIPSTNEIVSISTSFNRMAADLRRFRKELDIKTRSLEELNNEYRRLNEHLEAEVENKTRELKEFFSVVTHDLKVPLAAIQGYVDLLLRSRSEPLSEKQQRYVTSISGACAQLLGLTRNMMETVKYDAGKIIYYPEDFDLLEVAEEVRSQLRHAAEEKQVVINVDVPPLCRSVHGDPTKIAQVFTNLVNNAIKFTPSEGVVDVRARDRGAVVEVTVSDTGVGMTSEQISSLFEKFTQFQTADGGSSGVGLGLYIVRKILEGHGHAIRVQSSPGHGSAFVFNLAKAVRAGQVESLDTLALEPPRGHVPFGEDEAGKGGPS